MKVVTKAQLQKAERIMIDTIGVPSLVLMENAGSAVFRNIHAFCTETLKKPNPKVIVFAGMGRNGGNGFVVARHLFVNNYDVGVVFVGDKSKLTGDTLIHYNAILKMGVPVDDILNSDDVLHLAYTVETCDVAVDALYGLGYKPADNGSLLDEFIDVINRYACYVVSIDLPTGLDADTGAISKFTVKADLTVTFGFMKKGLLLYPGSTCAGKVIVENMSIPDDVLIEYEETFFAEGIFTHNDSEIPALLPNRTIYSHKYDHGKVFVLAGSKNMPGAAVLSSAAVYKAGGGYVRVFGVSEVISSIHHNLIDATTHKTDDTNGYINISDDTVNELSIADILVIGPGMGCTESTKESLRKILSSDKIEMPIIFDADALNLISYNDDIRELFKKYCNVQALSNYKVIITPHPGEFSRLTGVSTEEISVKKTSLAIDFAKEYNVIVVLKGATTVIAHPNGSVYINTTGNNALAKAGTGDVLTGFIAGFAAQGLNLFDAAVLATYIHGKAGEHASQTLSMHGVSAVDLLNCFPMILNQYM
jgi:NAD(P)H-hydrate epimerase